MTKHITWMTSHCPATQRNHIAGDSVKNEPCNLGFTSYRRIHVICLFFFPQKCFFQINFGLLSADRKSWTEHLVQSSRFEMRDLTPGSDYGISIQSVLGSDASRAVIKQLSTRKRHTCTCTKRPRSMFDRIQCKEFLMWLLLWSMFFKNDLSVLHLKPFNKQSGTGSGRPPVLQPALNLWCHSGYWGVCQVQDITNIEAFTAVKVKVIVVLVKKSFKGTEWFFIYYLFLWGWAIKHRGKPTVFQRIWEFFWVN